MTFRSLQMSQLNLIIPRDCVYQTVNLLGYQDALHFTDSCDPSDRHFSQMVKRCEQCLTKIDVISSSLKKEKLEFDEYQQNSPFFINRLQQNWKQQAQSEGVDLSKLFDIYEDKVIHQYKSFQDLTDRSQKMVVRMKQIQERIASLQVVAGFFGDSQPRLQNQNYYINNVGMVKQINNISFIVGVIDYDNEWKISKMIYRISRGYACTRTLDKFKFFGLKNFRKKVLLVMYPTSDSHVLQNKLKRVMQAYCQNNYSVNELDFTSRQALDIAIKEYNQISSLQEMGNKQYKEFMNRMRGTVSIQAWRIFFWKEKALYECLNKLDRREQFYIANAYVPKRQIKRISLEISKIVPMPTIHEVPVDNPPTAFSENGYIRPSQMITDTYGVPRYQQVNPSVFTTVTFPFFFGVMFGDIAHGAMVLALGIYLMLNNRKFVSGIMRTVADLRYMIAMMGFFAVYCGFIYNDMAGFNTNFFGSCYKPPMHPGPQDEKIEIHMFARNGCIYPFGIDPIWGRAENELVFVNSLKMKISVIIAIIHMSLGVCIKAANTLFFRKKIDFYFEFIPQFIFLFGLFGYMDFLIIFKWLKVWDERVGDIAPQQWAPSIISTMMNVGLGLGKTSTVPDGNSNMWGQRGNSSQDTIQMILLVVSFLCIPLMLIPKPIIEIRKMKKMSVNKKNNPLGMEDDQNMELSRNALQERLNPSGYSRNSVSEENNNGHSDGQGSSEIIVHQLIQTIEFVLGAVSNTASYLRLWALSLAHSQLSKVFFQQTAGNFFGADSVVVEFMSLFVGSWMVMWISFGIILCMDSMQCFLHSLRLHWVEFQNKFYKGDGYKYLPFSFKNQIISKKQLQQI